MTMSVEQPEFVTFVAALTIEAAADTKELPRFSMVAYSGGRMRIVGFPHAVEVDLDGLYIPGWSVPIRPDRKPTQGVAHTTRIAVGTDARESEVPVHSVTVMFGEIVDRGNLANPQAGPTSPAADGSSPSAGPAGRCPATSSAYPAREPCTTA